ncbi:myosin heavy chain, clone 203-like [Takifugu flavidus]|uniref:myosin heavy chain, clone 203-like n=1 Tax=Takifugu flavidus TaxID=433684 RepID=UPI002544777B|nr:myosin heavy chain, clone 203-like [Takifugu flavidus]
MIQHNDEKQELEQSIEKIQLQLKQANDQHKVMCNTIDKLEVNLQQGKEKIISLEEKYLKEVNAHEMTRGNLSQTIEELQVKFNQEIEEKQELEGKYENEKSLHEETQEQLVQANQQNKELEFQLQQAVVENMWTNENYQEERSAHKHTKEQLNHFEEFYEKEKTEHRITREELEQCIEKAKELHIRVKEVEEGNLLLEESYQKEKSDLKSMTDKAEELLVLLRDTMEKNKTLEMNWKQESSYNKSIRKELEEVQDQKRVINERIQQLEDQLQGAAEENEQIQEKHVTEMSTLRLQLQHTLEASDQAMSENKLMEEKLKQIEQLGGKEQTNQDQIQSQEKQFVKALQACMSVISDTKKLKKRIVAMKKCYLENEHAQISEMVEQVFLTENKDLSIRLQGCQNLLKVNSDTISRLEQQLSATVQQCDEREKKYVQL